MGLRWARERPRPADSHRRPPWMQRGHCWGTPGPPGGQSGGVLLTLSSALRTPGNVPTRRQGHWHRGRMLGHVGHPARGARQGDAPEHVVRAPPNPRGGRTSHPQSSQWGRVRLLPSFASNLPHVHIFTRRNCGARRFLFHCSRWAYEYALVFLRSLHNRDQTLCAASPGCWAGRWTRSGLRLSLCQYHTVLIIIGFQ